MISCTSSSADIASASSMVFSSPCRPYSLTAGRDLEPQSSSTLLVPIGLGELGAQVACCGPAEWSRRPGPKSSRHSALRSAGQVGDQLRTGRHHVGDSAHRASGTSSMKPDGERQQEIDRETPDQQQEKDNNGNK